MGIFGSFQTIKKVVTLLLLWICFIGIYALSLEPLVAIPLGLLFIDGLVFSFLIILIGLSYRILVKDNRYSWIIAPQSIFNYVTLGLFVIGLLIGGVSLFFWIVLPLKYSSYLFPTIPIHTLIAGLIYICWVIYDRMLPDSEETLELINECKEEVEAFITSDVPVFKDECEILERIAVKSGQKIQVILIEDIIYLQSDGDYVVIFTAAGKFMKEQTMKYFEEHLPHEQFVRIHRSYLVNVEMISRIELYKKQQQMLTLKNGHQLKTSIAGYKMLKSVLQL